jgi:hypothetical protein
MYQDEARFGRISDTRYCWARRPMRAMVKAMLTYQYTYAYGAVSPLDGKFDSLVLGTLVNRVNTSDKVAPWTYGLRALMQDLARRCLR